MSEVPRSYHHMDEKRGIHLLSEGVIWPINLVLYITTAGETSYFPVIALQVNWSTINANPAIHPFLSHRLTGANVLILSFLKSFLSSLNRRTNTCPQASPHALTVRSCALSGVEKMPTTGWCEKKNRRHHMAQHAPEALKKSDNKQYKKPATSGNWGQFVRS